MKKKRFFYYGVVPSSHVMKGKRKVTNSHVIY